MKSGIQLIADERAKVVFEKGITIEKDVEINFDNQLATAAGILSYEDIHELDCEETPPTNWDLDWWKDMYNKPYKERLVIAGQMIAAEIDRLNKINL